MSRFALLASVLVICSPLVFQTSSAQVPIPNSERLASVDTLRGLGTKNSHKRSDWSSEDNQAQVIIYCQCHFTDPNTGQPNPKYECAPSADCYQARGVCMGDCPTPKKSK